MKTILSICLILVITSSLRASEWAYTGFAPWLWSHSTNDWCYMEMPQKVWQDGEWILNPYLSDPFDVSDVLNATDSVISINLFASGQYYATITYDTAWDGRYYVMAQPPYGFISSGTELMMMDYVSSIDSEEATAVFFISSEKGYYASVSLEFSSPTSGTYTMLGRLDSNVSMYPGYPDLGELSGSFTVDVQVSPRVQD